MKEKTNKNIFDFWFKELGRVENISSSFRRRYAVICSTYSKLIKIYGENKFLKELKQSPRNALRNLFLVNIHAIDKPKQNCIEHFQESIFEFRSRHIKNNLYWGKNFYEVLKTSRDNKFDLDDFIHDSSPLEMSEVPIHPIRFGRILNLVNSDSLKNLVALKWQRGSVVRRIKNQKKFDDKVIKRIKDRNILSFFIYSDYDLFFSDKLNDPWVISRNLGENLEDLLRFDKVDKKERTLIVKSLRILREEMNKNQIIWGGFAPRNMFYSNQKIILIDFEDVYVNPNKEKNIILNLWHQIYFADCLTKEENHYLFYDHKNILKTAEILKDITISADKFEEILFGRKKIALSLKVKALLNTKIIEGKHLRSNGKILFGHYLGHFWGDFVDTLIEVRIYNYLCNILYKKKHIGICLEFFELAMEADLITYIIRSAKKEKDNFHSYTLKLINLLSDSNIDVDGIDSVHRSFNSWYADFIKNPILLFNKVAKRIIDFSANSKSLNQYFIGDNTLTKKHNNDLENVFKIGLDFVNSSDRNSKFIEYKTPKELIALICEKLPKQGLTVDNLLTDFNEKVAKYSIKQFHKNYLAFPDSSNSVASFMGDILSSFLNQNLIAFDRSAPSATMVEIQVIEWLRELIGYDSKSVSDFQGVQDVAGL